MGALCLQRPERGRRVLIDRKETPFERSKINDGQNGQGSTEQNQMKPASSINATRLISSKANISDESKGLNVKTKGASEMLIDEIDCADAMIADSSLVDRPNASFESPDASTKLKRDEMNDLESSKKI